MALARAKDLASWMGGFLEGPEDRQILRVHTDSRTALPGDAFVALRGPRFDGHDFVGAAVERGASAVVVEKPVLIPGARELPKIFVSDTLEALQRAARAYRSLQSTRWIAVTGSSGKTTTKELLSCALRARFRVVSAQGSQNNHIGVPLTLLRARREDSFGVVELGTNHPGEIAFLADLVRPHVALITGVGPAHIEFFGSLEAIAKEKTDLLEALPPEGLAVLNGEDPCLRRLAYRSKAPVLWVGGGSQASWLLETCEAEPQGTRFGLRWEEGGRLEVFLPLWGKGAATDLLLAVATAAALGVGLQEIATGLQGFRPARGRMECKQCGKLWVVDDSYNANPQSVKASLEAFRDLGAGRRKGVVLGTMGELGAWASQFHQRIGELLASLPVDWAVFVGEHAGELAKGAEQGGLVPDRFCVVCGVEEALAAVQELCRPGDFLLVKGSRSVGLDRLVEALERKE